MTSAFAWLRRDEGDGRGRDQAAGAAARSSQSPALRSCSRRLREIGWAPCAAIQATNSLSVMPIVSEAPGTGGRVLVLEPRFIVGTEVSLEIFNTVFEGCFEVNAVHPCLRATRSDRGCRSITGDFARVAAAVTGEK